MFCFKCGTSLPDEAIFCMKCGTKLKDDGNPYPAEAPKVQLIPISCPNCGGQLSLPADQNRANCSHCGYEFLVHDSSKMDISINLQEDIRKILDLAKTAEEAENYPQAYQYYTRATESDPNNLLAWLGKARMSIANFKDDPTNLSEGIACMNKAKAIGLVDSDDVLKTVQRFGWAVQRITDRVCYANFNAKSLSCLEELYVFLIQWHPCSWATDEINQLHARVLGGFGRMIYDEALLGCIQSLFNRINPGKELGVLNRDAILSRLSPYYRDEFADDTGKMIKPGEIVYWAGNTSYGFKGEYFIPARIGYSIITSQKVVIVQFEPNLSVFGGRKQCEIGSGFPLIVEVTSPLKKSEKESKETLQIGYNEIDSIERIDYPIYDSDVTPSPSRTFPTISINFGKFTSHLAFYDQNDGNEFDYVVWKAQEQFPHLL